MLITDALEDAAGGGGAGGLPEPARASLRRAASFLSRGCAGGSSASHGNCCFLLASMHMDARLAPAVAAPPAAAAGGGAAAGAPAPLPRSSGAADGGDAPVDPVSLLERACDAENVRACNTLSLLHRNGSARFGVAQDGDKATSYARRGLLLGGMSEAQAERHLKQMMAARGAGAGAGGAALR